LYKKKTEQQIPSQHATDVSTFIKLKVSKEMAVRNCIAHPNICFQVNAELVSKLSLTSLFSTNVAITETKDEG